MIVEEKKLMSYTYFNHKPVYHWKTTHLFSLSKVKSGMNQVIPFPTLTVSISGENFLQHWSGSSRTKVNKAMREGLVADRGKILLPDILKLFAFTAKNKRLRGYVTSDFDTLPAIACSAVILEGVMLCGHIWLLDHDEKRALLYVNASNQSNENEDNSLTGRAHYFLLWQDGLYLRNTGIQSLDLMGYDTKSKHLAIKGINQWKAGTHGKQEILYHHYPLWFYLLRKVRNMVAR